MIKNEELELLKLKEARIDFLESDSEASPIRRPMVRIAEVAQTFIAYDLYLARAELDREITKAETNLEPKVFKHKVASLKETMIEGIAEMKRQRELVDSEIKLIEETLDLNKLEADFQLELHEKLKSETK